MSLSSISTLFPGLLTTLTLWVSVMIIGVPLGLLAGFILNEDLRYYVGLHGL